MHGSGTDPFSVGLDVDSLLCAGGTGEGTHFQVLRVRVEAAQSRPACRKPCGQGELRGWFGDREMDRLICGGSATNKWAEEASEVAHSNRHGADSVAFHPGTVVQCALNVEGRKLGAEEELRRAKVVDRAAQAMFASGEHAVDEHAVGAGSGHNNEVARTRSVASFAGYATERDFAPDEGKLLAHGIGCVEGESQVTSQRIRAAERDHAQGHREILCQALNDLMQCAVAAAGEEKFSSGGDGIGSLRARSSRRVCSDDLSFDAAGAEDIHCRLQGSAMRTATAACIRIEN